MDANKLERLRAIGYRIQNTCGRCISGAFAVGSSWGTCAWYKYDHQKHTDKTRDLSIHSAGTCPSFTAKRGERLDGFSEFVEDK